jgi:hypothetical protein
MKKTFIGVTNSESLVFRCNLNQKHAGEIVRLHNGGEEDIARRVGLSRFDLFELDKEETSFVSKDINNLTLDLYQELVSDAIYLLHLLKYTLSNCPYLQLFDSIVEKRIIVCVYGLMIVTLNPSEKTLTTAHNKI